MYLCSDFSVYNISGCPLMRENCFGVADLNLSPLPAAGSTATTGLVMQAIGLSTLNY